MDEKFSPEQSLRLIQSMIDKTRKEISGRSDHFLVWGWITFAGCVGQFVLKHIVKYEKHYMVWLVVLIGIAFSAYAGIRDGKRTKVKTYVSDSMNALWTGMCITYLVLAVVLSKIGWENTVFPFYIILYALGTFVSGTILRFRPLIFGGLAAWVLAIISVFLSYDYQILAAAAAILISYIIPAYIIRSKEVKSINERVDGDAATVVN